MLFIVNAMDDENFASAVKATGRKKLIIAGVTNDVRIGLNPQPKADIPRHLRSYGDLVLVHGKSVLAINLS